jgi:hypothetical protein
MTHNIKNTILQITTTAMLGGLLAGIQLLAR